MEVLGVVNRLRCGAVVGVLGGLDLGPVEEVDAGGQDGPESDRSVRATRLDAVLSTRSGFL